MCQVGKEPMLIFSGKTTEQNDGSKGADHEFLKPELDFLKGRDIGFYSREEAQEYSAQWAAFVLTCELS